MPSRRQARRMRHLATRHHRKASPRRQVQKLLQPPPRCLLYNRRSRSARIQPRILVPRRSHPVRSQSRRQRPSDHPPKESPTRRADNPALNTRHQFIDHLNRIHATLAQRHIQLSPQCIEVRSRCHGNIGCRREMCDGMTQCRGQRRLKCGSFAHPFSLVAVLQLSLTRYSKLRPAILNERAVPNSRYIDLADTFAHLNTRSSEVQPPF